MNLRIFLTTIIILLLSVNVGICYTLEEKAFVEKNIDKLTPHDSQDGFKIWERFVLLVIKYKDESLLQRIFEQEKVADGAGADNYSSDIRKIFLAKPEFFLDQIQELQTEPQKSILDSLFGDTDNSEIYKRLSKINTEYSKIVLDYGKTQDLFNNPQDIVKTFKETARVSHYLESKIVYSAKNLTDNNFSTAWVIKRSWLPYVSLFINPENRSYLTIYNGYQKSQKLLTQNGQFKTIEIKVFSIENYMNFGYLMNFGYSSHFLLIKNQKEFKIDLQPFYSSIKNMTNVYLLITFKDVYEGNVYDDVCMSEIILND